MPVPLKACNACITPCMLVESWGTHKSGTGSTARGALGLLWRAAESKVEPEREAQALLP